MTTFPETTHARGPWLHRLDKSDLELFQAAADSSNDLRLVRLDGCSMATLDGFFGEYARGFEFPDYFGWNWAAFDECMSSLEWLPARGYLTIVQDTKRLLAREPEAMSTYYRQIKHIGRHWSSAFGLGPEWGGGEVPFHTVLVESRR